MFSLHHLWGAAAVVLFINLPFGYVRAGRQRFSVPWFLAVHAPVPLVIGVRLLSGLGWRLVTVPVFVGAFFVGQFAGGWARTGWRHARARAWRLRRAGE